VLSVFFEPSIFEDLPIHINEKREEWRKLEFGLVMRISSGELCCSVADKGIETGAVKTTVSYEGVKDDYS
jgi:hypothetical protein